MDMFSYYSIYDKTSLDKTGQSIYFWIRIKLPFLETLS